MADINATLAKKILRAAKKDHGEDYGPVYEDDIPKDSAKLIAEAEEVVEMAEEAKEEELDHPSIDIILDLAGVSDDDEEEDEEDDDDQPAKNEPDDEESEEPWDGYDKASVKDIKSELEDLSADELGNVYDYETENKNRPSVIKALEALAESDDDEDEDGDDGEPWDGYDKAKSSDVVKQLGDITGKDELEAIQAYEQENKARQGILTVLEELIEDISEDEEDDSDDEEDDTPASELPETEDIEEFDRDELEELIEEHELEVKFTKRTSDDKLLERVLEAVAELREDEEEDEDEEDDESEEPFDGYDDLDVPGVIKKLHKLDTDELAEVYDYETSNRNRKLIIKNLETLATEQGEDDDEDEDDTDDETEIGVPENREELEELEREELETLIEEQELEVKFRKNTKGGVLRERIADALAISEDEEEDEDEEGESHEADAKAAMEQDSDDEHEEIIAHITAKVDAENLSVPKKLPRDVIQLPFDLTEENDTEIRRLHSAFLSYFGRASYVARLEKQLANACRLIADEKAGEYVVANRLDDEDKERGVTILKAEAEADDSVRVWRRREHAHKNTAESFRDDAAIYAQNLESLSREWTMRHEEMQHSGGLSKRSGRK